MRLYGAGTRATSDEQARAIHATLNANRDILAVLPTSAGKSALYLVPALLQPDRTTILVAPYRALQWQHQEHLLAHRIDHATWPATTRCTVLVVSVEDLNDSVLYGHIAALHAHGQLARIVIDEAHVLLTDDYRHVIRQHLPAIRRVAVPLVMLTATLSVHEEAVVCRMMLSTPITFRLPSTRPNAKVGDTQLVIIALSLTKNIFFVSFSSL